MTSETVVVELSRDLIEEFNERHKFASNVDGKLVGEFRVALASDSQGGEKQKRMVRISHELYNSLDHVRDELETGWSEPIEVRFAPGGNLVHRPCQEEDEFQPEQGEDGDWPELVNEAEAALADFDSHGDYEAPVESLRRIIQSAPTQPSLSEKDRERLHGIADTLLQGGHFRYLEETVTFLCRVAEAGGWLLARDVAEFIDASLASAPASEQSNEAWATLKAIRSWCDDPPAGHDEAGGWLLARHVAEFIDASLASAPSEGTKDRCPTCGSSHPMFSGCKDPGQAKEETGRDFPTLPGGCADPWHEDRAASPPEPQAQEGEGRTQDLATAICREVSGLSPEVREDVDDVARALARYIAEHEATVERVRSALALAENYEQQQRSRANDLQARLEEAEEEGK